ncbi:MAG: 50S ribosomal protein L40e [Candidatus Aenigmatarchaeota archaeon]
MAKAKVDAVMKRIYERVYVCMKCNAKIRADTQKVMAGKVKCRKCKYKGLRLKSKERKV